MSASSAVLPMTVRSRGFVHDARPRRNFAAPVPPASAVARMRVSSRVGQSGVDARSGREGSSAAPRTRRGAGRPSPGGRPAAPAGPPPAPGAGSGGPSRDSTTTGPWSRAAAPARSVTTAPARRRPSAHAPRAQPGAGWGGHAAAANSNSPRAASRSSSRRYSTPRQTRGSVRDASGAARDSDGVGAVDANGRRGLLLAKHRVLQGLRDPELQDALGRDLEGLAGLRVAPHAGLAVG